MGNNTFEKDHYYEHDRSMDVFIRVVSLLADEEGTFLTVLWCNRGQTGKPWSHGIADMIFVKKKDYDKWQNCNWRLKNGWKEV